MTAPRLLLPIAALTLVLGGCGQSTGDRLLSGAGLGAAGGAVIGAATGGNPLAGAAIGAVGGAAVGALTTPSQVNAGRPAWRRGR